MVLHKKEEAICEELGDRSGLQASYGNQALILQDWGRLDEAMALHKKQEAICEELGDRSGLGFCYANLGLLYREQGDDANGTASLKKTLAIFTELNMVRQHDALLNLLSNET